MFDSYFPLEARIVIWMETDPKSQFSTLENLHVDVSIVFCAFTSFIWQSR